jgi:hypothetical protein
MKEELRLRKLDEPLTADRYFQILNSHFILFGLPP